MGSILVYVVFIYGVYGSSTAGFYGMYSVGCFICSRSMGNRFIKESVEDNLADSEWFF